MSNAYSGYDGKVEVAADLGDGATVVVDPVPPWIDEPEEGPPAVDPKEGV